MPNSEQTTKPIIVYMRVYESQPFGLVEKREMIVKIQKPPDSKSDVVEFLLDELKTPQKQKAKP